MSIRTKVIGSFLLVLFVLVAISTQNYFRARRASERIALINGVFLPLSRIVVGIQGNVASLAEDMKRFYFIPSVTPQHTTLLHSVRDVYPSMIQKKFLLAEDLLAKVESAELRGTVQEFLEKIRASHAVFDQLARTSSREDFEKSYRNLRETLQEVASRTDEECGRITVMAQKEGNENLVLGFGVLVFAALFSLVTLVLSYRGLKPLPRLIESIRKIADGDFHQSLKVERSDRDEISLLAREFNRMLGALRERDQKILAQQHELVKSERLAAVGQLSAQVVHEIRNPLNSISLNIDWLQSELSSVASSVKDTLISIAREVERLHQITESYLVRARVSIPEVSKAPVNELLQELVQFSREEDRRRNITVEANYSAAELYVKTDRSRLKQAFLNLMKNAREAMPRGGKLSIRTEVVDNIYRIQFSDSGYGMNDATRRLTFQPFFTTKPDGTGLGLILTKEIVETAEGTIHCDSQLGKGTTFTLHFPV